MLQDVNKKQINCKIANILTPAPGSQSAPLDAPLIELTG